jgi:SAM-dependent methyltransferase
MASMCGITQQYRRAGQRVFERAIQQNSENIARALVKRGPFGTLLDLGCDDGERTMVWASAARAQAIKGVEVVAARAALAEERGIEISTADLGGPLPYEDETVDAVVSNQVIEHLFDTDLFLAESMRVLRPGGIVVTSTENLASWHNVASLLLGWQPFSLTNVSTEGAIGNPLGLWADGDTSGTPDSVTWQHRRVFAARGLMDLHRAHGFTELALLGAGYYPLPRYLGQLNSAHAAFITVVGRRV